MKGEKMAKRSTFTSIVRKRLSDITNYSPPQPKLLIRKEKPSQVSPASEDLVKQLIKEKMTLLRVIEERDKIIELSENELENLRINLQKLQLQNWNLAQSNSQILAELNLGREKVKALQHELVCKDTLLKAKNIKKEEDSYANFESTGFQEGEIVTEECIPKAIDNDKPCERNRRRSARTMGPSTTRRQVSEKENVENKRRCVRRQSASFKSQEQVPTENFFKIQDTKLSVTLQADSLPQIKKLAAYEMKHSYHKDPLREEPHTKPAEKVQSYKELPLNVKMQRKEL